MPVLFNFPLPPPALIRIAAPQKSAGRGALLLPEGFLSTSGSQIVGADGHPVRIASIGWNGTDGPAGAALQGLWTASYKTILDAMVADGFNCVRIPWTDANLLAAPDGYVNELGTIHTTLNWDLVANPQPDANGHFRYMTTLEIFQKIVEYAGKIGLKVIFDHHSNEGTAGQQQNGLWFDKGPGSDDTDGKIPGRVTAATFQKNWVLLARTFAHNATVIGFDLDNEPNGDRGHINWGQGGPTDIKAMAETVGAAIQAVNPDALIIVEGPEYYAPPPENSGMDADFAAPAGDLTGVRTSPVRLPLPHKTVYSVHEYPEEISDIYRAGLKDSGKDYVTRLNRDWGWLYRQDVAPVWIGEMGASMLSPGAKAWAATLLPYMNGLSGAAGGPVFSGNQQPVSGSWWVMGAQSDNPSGIQSQWGLGHYRSEQQAVTDQMLFRARK